MCNTYPEAALVGLIDGGATAVGSAEPNKLMYVRLPSMDTNCWFGSADVITDTSPLPTPDGDISSAINEAQTKHLDYYNRQ